MRRIVKAAAALGCLWLAQGCAFLSKNEPLQPRYFTIDTPPPAAAAPRSELKLRLGAVLSGSDIRQYLMYRTTEHELSYSNEQRWTEKPEAFLRRALERALFEERGFQRMISGLGTTLEVELTAFEEVRQKPEHVRIAAVIKLHDGHFVKLEKTLNREEPLAAVKDADRPDAVAKALSLAMAALVEEIATQVSKP